MERSRRAAHTESPRRRAGRRAGKRRATRSASRTRSACLSTTHRSVIRMSMAPIIDHDLYG